MGDGPFLSILHPQYENKILTPPSRGQSAILATDMELLLHLLRSPEDHRQDGHVEEFLSVGLSAWRLAYGNAYAAQICAQKQPPKGFPSIPHTSSRHGVLWRVR